MHNEPGEEWRIKVKRDAAHAHDVEGKLATLQKAHRLAIHMWEDKGFPIYPKDTLADLAHNAKEPLPDLMRKNEARIFFHVAAAQP